MYLFRSFRLRALWNALAWGGTVALLVSLFSYFDGRGRATFLLEKGQVASDPLWNASFHLHVLASAVCLSIGPLLMIGRLIKIRAFHAWLGYLYINAVLWVAAPTGLLISADAKGGATAAAGFLLTGFLWWWTTWKGYASAAQKDLSGHTLWMVRSYSITLSAVWFRFLQLAMAFLPLQFDNRQIYITSVWGSLFISLLISETGIAKIRHVRARKRSAGDQTTPSTLAFFSKSGEIG